MITLIICAMDGRETKNPPGIPRNPPEQTIQAKITMKAEEAEFNMTDMNRDELVGTGSSHQVFEVDESQKMTGLGNSPDINATSSYTGLPDLIEEQLPMNKPLEGTADQVSTTQWVSTTCAVQERVDDIASLSLGTTNIKSNITTSKFRTIRLRLVTIAMSFALLAVVITYVQATYAAQRMFSARFTT